MDTLLRISFLQSIIVYIFPPFKWMIAKTIYSLKVSQYIPQYAYT